ncbi:DUF4270 domain-containing protein [uncultured Algibacter sp.]|uniref:DUF4270 domain-containing protein n=1 Tax=uncultured Algibacter sp. TaxID=298659 RepID=UPI002611B6BF|nr:DUF4270 domain-containing protein [uncultured Algibacter sp.]
MKKTIKVLKFSIVFILTAITFIACDKDFNIIESDVLSNENFNFATKDSIWPLTAYNKKLDSLQVNNLVSNLLGVFNDPAYGPNKASIITQITPSIFNPDFGTEPVIDSVIMSIPYFSTTTSTDEDGFPIYKLDSLYGNIDSDIKLTIFQNGYLLRDFDPNNGQDNTQKYYSNGSNSANSALNGTTTILFDDHIVNPETPLLNIDSFIPSKDPIITTVGEGEDAVTTRGEPAFRYPLNNEFWKETIIEKEGDAVLSNANNFHNYFRGLYFKAEATNEDGTMIQLNLEGGSITLYYTNGEEGSRSEQTYTLNFSGNKLNTFINNYDITLVNGDKTLGDAKLYLKGTEGSMAVVDLFKGMVDCDGDGIANDNALDCFKNTFRQLDEEGEPIKDPLTNRILLKRIINEAHLVIFEDENLPDDGGPNDYHFYDRIYAYDLKNNITTVDYQIDQTENTQQPFNSKIVSLGQRNPDSGKYKIRVTEHLNNILIRDSTNTKLGLVTSTNVNYTGSGDILNSSDEVTEIPSATILSPRGTIIYGSKGTAGKENKKLQLKIFYTESK